MKAALVAISVAMLGGDIASVSPKTSAAEAEFRWWAKYMFDSLETPSCTREDLKAPVGFHRTELLRPQRNAVADFVRTIQNTPAHLQFDIAKADAAYEIKARKGCWAEYNELKIAQRHLKMTQDEVQVSLPKLAELAPSIESPGPSKLSGDGGVQFRALVRDLVRTSKPRCRQTVTAENESLLMPAKAEVARFRGRLTNTPYAKHFDIAQADVAYEYSRTEVECEDPGRDAPTKVSREFLNSVRRQITAIQRRLKPTTG